MIYVDYGHKEKIQCGKYLFLFFFTKTSFLSVRLQSIKTRAYNLYLTKGLKIKTRNGDKRIKSSQDLHSTKVSQ